MREGTRNPHFTQSCRLGVSLQVGCRMGGRQIVNFAMPGDMIGPPPLAGARLRWVRCSISSKPLSPMLMGVFQREETHEPLPRLPPHPPLAYDVTWIAAREESILRREPAQRRSPQRHGAARLPVVLHHRASRRRRPRSMASRWKFPSRSSIWPTRWASRSCTPTKTVRNAGAERAPAVGATGGRGRPRQVERAIAGWTSGDGPPRPLI